MLFLHRHRSAPPAAHSTKGPFVGFPLASTWHGASPSRLNDCPVQLGMGLLSLGLGMGLLSLGLGVAKASLFFQISFRMCCRLAFDAAFAIMLDSHLSPSAGESPGL